MEMTVMNTQKPGIRSAGKTGPWALTFLLWIFIFLSASFGETVLVIRERGAAFEKALKGLQDELENEMEIRELIIGPATPADSAARVITDVKPVMAVLMDNRAVRMFKAYQAALPGPAASIPSVSCMGIDIRSAVKELRHAVGITYEVPIVTSLVALRTAVNRPLKKVGIVHRRWQQPFIEENRGYCVKEGIELVTRELPDDPTAFRTALKPALESLLGEEGVQALWVPTDNILLTPELIQDIWSPLINKFKVPAVVGVETLVNPALDMGTFAVLPDHRAMGAQAAEFILNAKDAGWKVWEKNVEPPVAVKKTVNLRHMSRFFGLEKKDMGSVDTFLVMEKGMDIRLASSRGGFHQQLSLADLLNMEVTSVSKKKERLMDVPSSIYVLTEEDIRRSGATRLVDLLNMVPGFWSNDRSYTSPNSMIRDDTEVYSMTVNVLIDGVPIITPITGGIFYEGFNFPLSEIERIEVIKGPGGTVYGANSATGIISIFTKKSTGDELFRFYVDGGNRSYIAPTVRMGTRLGEKTSVSALFSFKHHGGYAKNPDFAGDSVLAVQEYGAPLRVANLYNDPDEGRSIGMTGGMNIVSEISPKTSLSADILYQRNRIREYSSLAKPIPDVFGMPQLDSIWIGDLKFDNLILNGRADHRFSSTHQAFFHAYRFDYLNNFLHATGTGNALLSFDVNDFEIQDNINFFQDRWASLELITGSNFRIVNFNIDNDNSSTPVFYNPEATEYLTAGFVQTKLSLGPMVDIISGIKAEYWTLANEDGPGYSPSIKAVVKPVDEFTLWFGWSRSLTMPAYIHTNMEQRRRHLPPAWAWDTSNVLLGDTTWRALGLEVDSVPPAIAGKWISLVISGSLKPTDYRSWEAGSRFSPFAELFGELNFFYTTFQNSLTDLPLDSSWQTIIPSKLYPGDSIVPIYWGSLADGHNMGTEFIIRASPLECIKLELSHVWNLFERESFGKQNYSSAADIAHSPEHVVRWRLYLNFFWETGLSMSGLWHSEYDNTHAYNYVLQKWNMEGGNVDKDLGRPGWKLDFKIEKRFLEGKLSAFVWGSNILADNEYEAYYWYVQDHPQTVSRTFGAGLSGRF